jgi:hypothetical protein
VVELVEDKHIPFSQRPYGLGEARLLGQGTGRYVLGDLLAALHNLGMVTLPIGSRPSAARRPEASVLNLRPLSHPASFAWEGANKDVPLFCAFASWLFALAGPAFSLPVQSAHYVQ